MADVVKYETPQDALMVVIENGPQILALNQERLEKVRVAVKKVLAEIAETGMNQELDGYLNKMQVRIKEVLAEMKDERMDLTRGLDAVKQAFTGIEAELDPAKDGSLFNQLGTHRNAFAKQQAEEKKRRDEESRKKMEAEKEGNQLRADIRLQVEKFIREMIADDMDHMVSLFESVTLDDYHATQEALQKFTTTPHKQALEFKVKFRPVYLATEVMDHIIGQVQPDVMNRMVVEYEAEMAKKKRELLDQMPGKLKHLQDMEQKRQEEEAARKKAEEEAEAAKALADEAERKAAEQRAAAAKAEADRIEKERLEREEQARKMEDEQRRKDAEEQRRKDEEAEKQAEIEKQLLDANTHFQGELELAETEGPKAVEGWEIQVKAPQGWLQIISYYFQNKGNKESLEQLEKRTLKQMLSFCEREYKKTGVKIESGLLEYVPTYKMQAKK